MSRQSLSWGDFLGLVVSQKGRKCPLRLLDTIFLNNVAPGSAHWYFTTKAGVVSRKKGENSQLRNVADRFQRFALANPSNTDGYIGVLVDGATNRRQELGEEQLRSLLDGAEPEMLAKLTAESSSSYLQVYLRPKGGSARLLSLEYSPDVADGVAFSSRSMHDGSSSSSSSSSSRPQHSDFTRGQAQGFSGEVIAYLRDAMGLDVDAMTMDFVVDDNEHAWLSSISSLTVSPAREGENEKDKGTGPLPSLAETENDVPIPSSSSAAVAVAAAPKSASRSGSASRASSAVRESIETLGLGGSDLIRKEGGVYHAAQGPDELPGLRAWTLASLSDNDRMGWAVDLAEYTSLPSPMANLAELRKRRAQTRMVAMYRFVAMSRFGEKLLTGQEPVDTEEDFVSAWKQVLLKTSSSDPAGGRLQSEVTVDGNLFGICRKLEALVEANFRATVSLPPREVPVTVSALDSPNKGGNLLRPMSGPGRPGSRASASRGSMRTASAGSNMEADDGGLAAADRAQAALIAGELGSLKRGAKKGKKKKPTPYEMPQPGDPDLVNKPLKRFGKNGDMEAPPNIEMIAKFAAEKEKAMKSGANYPEDKAVKKKGGKKKSASAAIDEDEMGAFAMMGGGLEDSGEVEDFLKKNKAKKRKQKGFNARDEEARLAELEALAEQAKEQFKKGPGPQGGRSGGGGGGTGSGFPINNGLSQASMGSLAAGSMMSDVEADFMYRQAAHGQDLSQLNQLSSLAFDDGGTIQGGGTIQDNVTNTLKERVEHLEKQNANLTQILTKRNIELEASEGKTRDLKALLESQRLASANQLLKIEEEHRKQVLALKEGHSREMASVLAPIDEPDGDDVDVVQDPTQSQPKLSKADARHHAQQLLMEQIEKLRTENKRLIEEHHIERRAVTDDLKGKAMVVESSLRSEVSELRARCVNLEDDLSAARDDTVAAKAKTENISRLCKQLEQDRKEAIDNQDKLRADLANMQQSVAASYRLESSQGMAAGLDADTTIKMHEAKAEAKERQLSNKVEFLKAQLSAEQATTEELKKDKDHVRVEMEEMKEEFKKRFKELEKTKMDAVAETERLVEQRYEERMTELTTLQAKMQLLNAQLQDAFHEGSLSKQREDAAKAATAKAMAHQAAMKNEADGLRKQVEELRDKQDELMSRESGRQNSEAMLRRLDNERQYLKSQLASEITHKNEVQTTLNNVQQQLADVQKQWKIDVETLQNKQTQVTNTNTQKEQRSMQTTLHLQSECERLTKANTELKEGFTKTRDLLRSEQLALENLKSSGKRMLEELEQSREDVARLRQEIEDDAEIHKQQREALNESLREMDARRLAETKALREEVSRGYASLSEAQKEAMMLSDRLNGEKGRQSNMLHAARVFEVLHRWRRSRLYEYFRKWSVNSTLTEMASQFRVQVDGMVENLQAEADANQAASLESQRKQLKDEEEIRVEALAVDAEKAQAQVRRECEEEAKLRVDEMKEEFKTILEEKDQQWAMEVDLAVAAGENEAAKAAQRAEMKIIQIEERVVVEKKDMEFAFDKKLTDALSVANFTKDEEWTAKLTEREAALVAEKEALAQVITEQGAQRLEDLRQEKQKELEAALKEKEEKRMADLRSATDAADQALSLLKNRLMNDHAQKVENLQDDHDDAMRALRQEMHEHAEERMRILRESWVEEKNEAIRNKEDEFEDMMEKRMADQGKIHERDMAAIVKVEAAKWQQALREAEKRFRLEAKQAHGEGWAARDRDARTEIQQVNSEHLMKANQVAELHKQAVAEMAREHAAAMTDLKNKMEEQQMKEVARAEREMKHVTETEWADKMKARVDEVWAESADTWQSKMARETEKLESFKADVAKDRQRQAEERTELMQRISQSDELLKSIEDLNNTEMRRIREEHQKALNALTAKMEKMKSSTVKDIEAKSAEQLEQAELAFRQEMAAMLKLERDRTTENMETQMKDVQQESEKMIKRLEKAVQGLKEEKTNLMGELTELTQKCEDTEDALYDAQKEQKKRDKANSLAIWRSMTNMATMRLRFQKGMEAFDQEAAATLEKVQRKAQSKVDQMTLTGMQYSGVLVNVEKVRERLHDTLVNYKQETLIEKRTQIKMLERDLDKLTVERDNLEEQRETMDEETAGLEAQVRELEEQIREHNRSSSMTNGRINVAHARKKRRLDSELERILELIEQRRIQISDLDDKVAERGRARDEKESRMIDLEKDLVGVLLEQQKKVLSLVEEASFEEKNRTLASVAGFKWPPVKINPTMADVKALRRERQAEAEDEKKAKRDRGEEVDSEDEGDESQQE